MRVKELALLMPFIFMCLGFLSIVIGAFLFNEITGYIVLGITLIVISMALNDDGSRQK